MTDITFLQNSTLWADFLNVAVATFTCLYSLFIVASALEKRVHIIPHTAAVLLLSLYLVLTKGLIILRIPLANQAAILVIIVAFLLSTFLKFKLHIKEKGLYVVLIILAATSVHELLQGPKLGFSILHFLISCYLFAKLFSRILFPGITEKVCIFYTIFILISGYTVVSFVNSYQSEVASKCVSDVQKASSAFTFRMSYFKNLLKSALLMKETEKAILNPSSDQAIYHFNLLRYLYKSDIAYFMDSNGTIKISSMPQVVGKNFKYRIYFKKAIKGKPCVYISRGVVTNISGLFFAFPYWHRGKIIGVMVFKYSLESVFPVNIFQGEFLLIHRSGLVIEGPEKFVGSCIYCNREILKRSLNEGLIGKVKYKGEPFLYKGKNIICEKEHPENCYAIAKAIIPNTSYYIAKIASLNVITSYERNILSIWMAINLLVVLILIEIQNWSDLMSYDPLTMFLNRETLMIRINELFARSCRNGSCIHLLMIDLDRFKKINDTYGHLVGDAVLKGTAKLIKECLRPYDLMGRYGGEEFLVVFESQDPETGVKVAERIRTHIEKSPIKVGKRSIKVTVSIGVKTICWNTENANCREVSETVIACIKEADKALYKAKASGRNRVIKI